MNEEKSIRLEVADGLYLSPIVRADKAAYLEHFADPEIAQNLLAIPFPYTEADADWWLDRCEHSIGKAFTSMQLSMDAFQTRRETPNQSMKPLSSLRRS